MQRGFPRISGVRIMAIVNAVSSVKMAERAENMAMIMKRISFCVLLFLMSLCVGCFSPKYDGGKIVEGTDISVGFALPVSEGTWQIDVLNYLSGYRFSFREGAGITCEYEVVSTTSFAGVYSNTTKKKIRASLNPTVDEQLDKTETKPEDDSAEDKTPCSEKVVAPMVESYQK